MGNLYSKVWPIKKKKESSLYQTAMSKKATMLTAVEDIQKLTPEQIEEQFRSVCRASTKVLRSLTHNPCGQLSIRIKNCLDENVQQMSKCFAVMNEYKTCVNNMMSEKLADMVADFEEDAAGKRNENNHDLLKESDAVTEDASLIEELEKELKRRVEELYPMAEAEQKSGEEKLKQGQEWEDENDDIKTCA